MCRVRAQDGAACDRFLNCFGDCAEGDAGCEDLCVQNAGELGRSFRSVLACDAACSVDPDNCDEAQCESLYTSWSTQFCGEEYLGFGPVCDPLLFCFSQCETVACLGTCSDAHGAIGTAFRPLVQCWMSCEMEGEACNVNRCIDTQQSLAEQHCFSQEPSEPGANPEGDICAQNGAYSNGVCDIQCPQADPECVPLAMNPGSGNVARDGAACGVVQSKAPGRTIIFGVLLGFVVWIRRRSRCG